MTNDVDPSVEERPSEPSEPVTSKARIRARVSLDWSWATAHAGIPQIDSLTIEATDATPPVRVEVVVSDGDLVLGRRTVAERSLKEGTTTLGSVHVPLSSQVMSQIDERRPAECVLTVTEIATSQVIAHHVEEIDVQPRNLWNWAGDPRATNENISDRRTLARSLLAAFVRPNHPEIAAVAREAADVRGQRFGSSSFSAFQNPERNVTERQHVRAEVDATVTSVYEALRARSIAYSEPPPGWDYTTTGQRIRDHGEVARGGLGTCMDTTVLMAAVLEHVGLAPVMVLVPGHIFIGYWRQDPAKSGLAETPDWYPGSSVVGDLSLIRNLVEAGLLGLVETTAFTVGKELSADAARAEARDLRFAQPQVTVVDVAAARRAGVSPLPAVVSRADGVTEVHEYRVGGQGADVSEVAPLPELQGERERRVDTHPPRYRTWKSSLFALNSTNALLNLGTSGRVQPIVLPPAGLGTLEDMLNEDVSLLLHSGYDLPPLWEAKDIRNAADLLRSGLEDGPAEVLGQLKTRHLFVQRIGKVNGKPSYLGEATFIREIRSLAHTAKVAREERGMNPLYLCLGVVRWEYKPGAFADAPMILVPVKIEVRRGSQEFRLVLDNTQQTTPNAALIELLRREHGITVPGLAEPAQDKAGIDVDGVIEAVRDAILATPTDRRIEVVAEARLATLDLSAFRMWQDLNTHADHFFARPLVHHLIRNPTQTFVDPAVPEGASEDDEEALETLETPIPADSTQKRAVLWARQGRTFVLQGPPGTGKSQTITNVVAECLLAGQKVLFVAEKGTALSVVQRRLDQIGLGPFTLNLHHEGSSATVVREHLKRSLTASVTPDPVAMEAARRQLRTARFELTEYPTKLHRRNAAGHSAYSAHDELLLLGQGATLPVPVETVAHRAELVAAVRATLAGLQPYTAAAGVRPRHPWRLANSAAGDSFDVTAVAAAVRGVLEGSAWARSTDGDLRTALDLIRHPRELATFASACNPALPAGDELAQVLDPSWHAHVTGTLGGCRAGVAELGPRLRGFSPDVLALDLPGVAEQFEAATQSGFLGRKGRQNAALAPLLPFAPDGATVEPGTAPGLLADLVVVHGAAQQMRQDLARLAGMRAVVPSNPFAPHAFEPFAARLEELTAASAPLRGADAATGRARHLAVGGALIANASYLLPFAHAWTSLSQHLAVGEDDLAAWRHDDSLVDAVTRVEPEWRRDAEFDRLVSLQRWCALVSWLEPLRTAGLVEARTELLEGRMQAASAEDAFIRGVAGASQEERIVAEGLDRFDALTHDQRVAAYVKAQEEVRVQWRTEGPRRMLEARGAGGRGSSTGGLARELERTSRKLGTRALLRKYGDAVQELTPLVLCSPSSVVDLIEPGTMDFDLVVFDEASQITVPEAIGALGRAKAAVIVGDSKQMPPSRLITRSEDEEELEDGAEEVVEDQESILSECELARVETLSLNWHYRSQDEALIAFSNRAYYRGELSSFPTPTLLSTSTGVEFRRVRGPEGQETGLYLRAGSGSVDLGGGVVASSNTNPVEALAIVRHVHELVNRSEELPSIGIVTFNEPQRQLIEELLHSSDDPRVGAVLDADVMGHADVLFVKALEQVQGDERDAIIFSVAFSKQANGRVPTNFGPLSRAGGERRLNVAVTRARRKNVVFCSFEPTDLDVANSAHQGPKDLKEFLAFARAAGATGEDVATSEGAVRDRHRDEIADALRAAGLHVLSDVGMSNFKLDLVLADAGRTDRPLLPVLLDGESWRGRRTVSDRDVLPVEVLEGLMGWPSVARVWWPMWLQNRDEVIETLVRLTAEARESMGDIPDEVELAPAAAEQETTVLEPAAHVAPPLLQTPERGAALEVDAARPALEDVAPEPADVSGMARGETISPAPTAAPQTGEFAPASVDVVGDKDLLDRLDDPTVREQVRAQVLDVVAIEGPVEATRLARIVGRRFGMGKMRSARVNDVLALVPEGALRDEGEFGRFVWPEHLDPTTWTDFRVSFGAEERDRTIEEISPQEITNVMRVLRLERPELTDEDDSLRATAEVFGISRLGAKVRARLSGVRARLDARPEAPSTQVRVEGELPYDGGVSGTSLF